MQSIKQNPTKNAPKVAQEEESFEDRQRRSQAARVLESQEQLIWYSMARQEDVAQTRRYFRALAAGLDPKKLAAKPPGSTGADAIQSARKGTARALSRTDPQVASSTMSSSTTKRKLAES